MGIIIKSNIRIALYNATSLCSLYITETLPPDLDYPSAPRSILSIYFIQYTSIFFQNS